MSLINGSSHSLTSINLKIDNPSSSNTNNASILMSMTQNEAQLFGYSKKKNSLKRSQSFFSWLKRKQIFRSPTSSTVNSNFMKSSVTHSFINNKNPHYERRFSMRNFFNMFTQFREQLFSIVPNQLKHQPKDCIALVKESTDYNLVEYL